MSEDENKSGTGFFAPLRGGGGKKSYWWLPFACVFLFLLAGGYYAIIAMRQSAQKLVGGDSYNQLSANSAIYSGGTSVPKSDSYFTEEEQASAGAAGNAGEAASAAGDKLKAPGRVSSGNSGSSSAAVPEEMAAEEGGGQGGSGFRAQSSQSSMSAKLQARSSNAGAAGGPSKTSGQSRSVAFQENGGVAGVTSAKNNTQAAAPKGGGGPGVLESLKGAFRASVYGSRIASQDSAKGWIARSFDATPEARTTIQYSDRMKADLDVVNPNSIPNFLRDQDLSAAGAKTLSASAVSKPKMDEDAAKAAEEKAAKEKSAVEEMLPGMMNSMFSGLGPKTDTPDEESGTDGEGDDKSLMSDPKAKPDVGVTDEYGYTSYGPSDGFQTIFGEDGKQVGCTDNAAGISYPFGSPGCM